MSKIMVFLSVLMSGFTFGQSQSLELLNSSRGRCKGTELTFKLDDQHPTKLLEDFCHSLTHIYPELVHAEIELKEFKKEYVNLMSNFGTKRVFSQDKGYVLLANKDRMVQAYSSINQEAVYAILTHELAHTYTFYLLSLSDNLSLIPIVLNDNKNPYFEKLTDLIAIYKSIKAGINIAPGLVEYRLWQRNNLNLDQEEKYVKTYYQADILDGYDLIYCSNDSLKLKLSYLKLKMRELNKVLNLNPKFFDSI